MKNNWIDRLFGKPPIHEGSQFTDLQGKTHTIKRHPIRYLTMKCAHALGFWACFSLIVSGVYGQNENPLTPVYVVNPPGATAGINTLVISSSPLPSCSTASSALTWNTTTTQFGCNIISGSLSGGTDKYIPVWTGNSSQSISVMYQSSVTNAGYDVDIGTTVPTIQHGKIEALGDSVSGNPASIFRNPSDAIGSFGTCWGNEIAGYTTNSGKFSCAYVTNAGDFSIGPQGIAGSSLSMDHLGKNFEFGSSIATSTTTIYAGTNIYLQTQAGGKVGVLTATPGFTFDVNGDINTNGSFRINGVPLVAASAPLTLTEADGGNADALTVNQNDKTNNKRAVVIVSTGTGVPLQVTPQGFVSNGFQNKLGAITVGDDIATRPFSTLQVFVDSTPSSQQGGGLVEIWEDNPNHNDPLFWIHRNASNSAPEIRVDGLAPNMEVINTSTGSSVGRGKWEVWAMPYQGIQLQLNSRAYDNSTFENVISYYPLSCPDSTKCPLMAGMYFQSQSLTNDEAVMTSSDTIQVGFTGLNSSVVGLTGPQNPIASWAFALPNTFNNQGQVMSQSDNGRGGNMNARSLAFTSGGVTNDILNFQSGSLPAWTHIPILQNATLTGLSSNTIVAVNNASTTVSMPQMGVRGLIVGNGVGIFPSTATLTAGSNITLTYPDASGGLTIAASGGGGGGSFVAVGTGTSSGYIPISSPTVALNFDSTQFTGQLTSASTTYIKIANSGVTAATYGSATQIPQIIIGADGRITSASNISVTGSTVGFSSATITSNQTGIGTTFTTITGSTLTLNIQTANDGAVVCFAFDYDENAVGGGSGVIDVLVDNVRQGGGSNGGVLTLTDGVASQNNGNGVCIPTGTLSKGNHSIYLQAKDVSASTLDLKCAVTSCFVNAFEIGGIGGSGAAAGGTGNVQWNNAGSFAGAASLNIGVSSISVSTPIAISSGIFLNSPNIVNANYAVVSTDTIILASSTVNSVAAPSGITITLDSSNNNKGQVLNITKIDTTTGPVNIIGAGTDVINGTGTVILNAYFQTASIISDGSGHWIPYGQGIQGTPAYLGPGAVGNTANHIGSINGGVCASFSAFVPVAISSVGFHLGASSGNMDIGIYDRKFNRLSSKGSTAVPAAQFQTLSLPSPLNLSPGNYWACISADNTTATFMSMTASTTQDGGFISCTSVFPLPATLTTCSNTNRTTNDDIWVLVSGGSY